MKNYIEASTHNGIVCEGSKCWPDIKANILEANRKAGIRLMDMARAHIGGEGFDDINKKMTYLDCKSHMALYNEMFEDSLGGGNFDSSMGFYEVLEATAEFKDHILKYIASKVPQGNSIM
mmetsp:Transcript_21873/g.33911  ORF Transcript_21873/g.33911 Transcript_21873/m.33911 type:complete len:120 (+) Transcript_21873:1259-1618(+)